MAARSPACGGRFGLGVETGTRLVKLNCDGTVGLGDINSFVLVLSNPTQWQQAYPGCPLLNADVNHDGSFNLGDINPFVALLAGSP
jgi:hypothetical protein